MMDSSSKMITVLTPVAPTPQAHRDLAPRVADLAGVRIGLLDNGKPNADLLLDHIQESLRERFGIAQVVRRRKSRVGLVAEYLDELAAQCDVVVNGVAD